MKMLWKSHVDQTLLEELEMTPGERKLLWYESEHEVIEGHDE